MSSLTIDSEIKIDTEPCVAAWDGKLFVGTNVGTISVFDENLSPGVSWPAHNVQLFALAASNGTVYSSSNDGDIRTWSNEGKKITELSTRGADVGVIKVFGEHVYAGDEDGNIIVYEDNKLKAIYNVLEEVKDLCLKIPYMFTARDLYVTATEVKPEESKTRFVTRHTMEGRAPMLIMDSYLLAVARGGNSLLLHDASVETTFKKLHEVKVSDMIVTSLSANDGYVWTGGWDGIVRRWKIADNQLQPAGDLQLGACINALVSTAADNAYALLTCGRLIRIKAA